MEKIVERIRKLMALAGNNPSEAEREAALKKAHQLLLEHNLQIQDVQETVEEVGAKNMKVNHPSPWSRIICMSIADLYFCKFVFTRQSRGYTAHFVGMRVDAEIAMFIADDLIRVILQQAHMHNRMTGGSVASFKNGAATTIHLRCKAMRREAEVDKVPGTALVVQSLYKQRAEQNTEWVDKNFGKLKSAKKLTMKFDESSHAGSAFAKGLSLTQKVA